MIGLRVAVVGGMGDYVYGLLLDEGLVPEQDVMPTGGNEFIVAPDAFDNLDSEVRSEVARFTRPGSDVVVSQPAVGDDSDTVPAAATDGSPRRGRSTRSTTKGVTDGR